MTRSCVLWLGDGPNDTHICTYDTVMCTLARGLDSLKTVPGVAAC